METKLKVGGGGRLKIVQTPPFRFPDPSIKIDVSVSEVLLSPVLGTHKSATPVLEVELIGDKVGTERV